MASSALSPFCRPEEDPFLLLESSLRCIERILLFSEGRPLRRTWIEHPYGEEEITLLEEEVLPLRPGALVPRAGRVGKRRLGLPRRGPALQLMGQGPGAPQ